MTLDACATLVQKGDPDRWAAVLAAPAKARPILLPIYAANVEIARAPFASAEPMIAEMRVQWWRDALDEIAEGRPVRAHEVTTPLAAILPPEAARDMTRICEARRRDCWNTAICDPAELQIYLTETGGALMSAAARALGADQIAPFETLGTASALANLLLARPELAVRGRDLSRDIAPSSLVQLASQTRSAAASVRARGPATLAAHLAPTILALAARDPAAIDEGRLTPSEFRRRLSLLRAAFTLR